MHDAEKAAARERSGRQGEIPMRDTGGHHTKPACVLLMNDMPLTIRPV
ncbi:hypothetical protein BCAM0344 [Burkholderia cenocepacia J2315]|jgi:hypothetical protein|uniref:Uncharacterized protein n=1 Tax=Burkholderia cenocepacia (strain ATCC BAA-245 / DSM 16553 / LMG 16656 / NCTC 13227 / J2315 / CF5610) TaxID=216591 RepID=B4EIT4_BURCJ|nr:hypothetical protein BCAM0344 [Burkholderia cenocepacia J2315]